MTFTRPSAAGLDRDKVAVRVSIPAGAAVVPNLTANIDDTTALGPLDPREPVTNVLLGPNTLARVTVTKGYTRVGGSKLGYWKSSRTDRDLASFADGVPQKGTAEVVAPWWAWSEAELDEYFLAGSERVAAGWWFKSIDHVRAVEEARARHQETRRGVRDARHNLQTTDPGYAVAENALRQARKTSPILSAASPSGRRGWAATSARVLTATTRFSRVPGTWFFSRK